MSPDICTTVLAPRVSETATARGRWPRGHKRRDTALIRLAAFLASTGGYAAAEGGEKRPPVPIVYDTSAEHAPPKMLPKRKKTLGDPRCPPGASPLRTASGGTADPPSLNKSTPCFNNNKVNDAYPKAFDKA